MVGYSQKDIEIKINNSNLFCSRASLTPSAHVAPRYSIEGRHAFDFLPNAPSQGSFEFSYFLTGSDPLTSHLKDEAQPISINFNGLSIQSGFLTSYSLSAEAFSVAQVNASLTFWEKVQGTFNPVESPLKNFHDFEPLAISSLSLDDGSVVTEDNIKSINYSCSTMINPTLLAGGDELIGVKAGEKKISSNISLYDYDMLLPSSGIKESFKINFKDKNNNSKQVYNINAVIREKKLEVSSDGRAVSSYSMDQASMGEGPPGISTMNKNQAKVNETFKIAVSNASSVEDIDKVYIGEYPCEISSLEEESGTLWLTAIVNPDMLSGFQGAVKVVTLGGEHIYTSNTFKCTSGVTFF